MTNKEKINDRVRASVWESIEDSVRASVWDSVRASVWVSVWVSVETRVGDSVSILDAASDSVPIKQQELYYNREL